MDTVSNLNELLSEAFANGATGFTLRDGLHPLIYSAKGVQTYDAAKCATYGDIEELLRELVNSREMRRFRSKGVIHFKSMFQGQVSLVGGAKLEGESIRVELRKMAA
jgi:Tfp pilus assembly pilus retraction ATPase PilT